MLTLSMGHFCKDTPRARIDRSLGCQQPANFVENSARRGAENFAHDILYIRGARLNI